MNLFKYMIPKVPLIIIINQLGDKSLHSGGLFLRLTFTETEMLHANVLFLALIIIKLVGNGAGRADFDSSSFHVELWEDVDLLDVFLVPEQGDVHPVMVEKLLLSRLDVGLTADVYV